jgi:hypothetical protein
LPAGSAAEAAEGQRARIAQALSCLTRSHVISSGLHLPAVQPRAVVLSDGDAVALRGNAGLTLSVAEHFSLAQVTDGWSTVRTAYFIELGQRGGDELLAFHWHPVGASRVRTPHLHVGAEVRIGSRWLPKVHVPTGAVALQDVLTLCIEELEVEPIRDDWRVVLERSRESL